MHPINDFVFPKTNLSWIERGTVTLVLSGSHAYGTNTSESDLDYRGICIPPLEYFFGFNKKFEQLEVKDPDLTIFNIVKYFNLAADCNPNILEILFCREENIVYDSDINQRLRGSRNLFLSKKARFTYGGYAFAQLKRIKLHRGYLLNPIKEPPKRKDFGLPERHLINKDQMGAYQSVLDRGDVLDVPTNFLEILDKEKRYEQAKKAWESYQNWKTERNPKRRELEEKCGFDCKHGSHLIRLLRTCKELLTTGKLSVYREDHEDLLRIKQGHYTYDQVIEEAENIEKELDALYESCTVLPKAPNRDEIDKLLVFTLANLFIR
jgi:predicted nucleotidyltransferase